MSKTFTIFKTKLVAVLAALGLVCTLAVTAAATTFYWTGEGGDESWENPLNWDANDIPTNAADVVNFQTESEEWRRVALGNNYTNDSLGVGADHVLLDLSGKTLELESFLRVCNVAGATGGLQITNGIIRKTSTNSLHSAVGYSEDTVGTLVLSGANTELEIRNAAFYAGLSKNSKGYFHILNGAKASFDKHFYIGNGVDSVGIVVVSNATLTATSTKGTGVSNAGSDGTIIVTGTNGVFNSTGNNFYNGHTARGMVIVENGGLMTGSARMIVGYNGGGHGVCRVVGAGSEMYQGSFMIGTKSATSSEGVPPEPSTGTGDIEVLDGGLLSTTDTGSYTDYFYIGDGCSLRIRDASVKIASTTGGNRQKPLFLAPGAVFTVELTPGTSGYIEEKGSLLWAGAIGSKGDGTNVIDGASLDIRLASGFVPPANSVYSLIRYDGALRGEFAGRPQGTEFFVDGARFSIDYGERNADYVTLKALPPEGSLIILR